jgi:hypothetical protein
MLSGACSKAPPALPGWLGYAPKDNSFFCHAPGDWRVLEDQGGAHKVSFFGPAAGPAPYSESIAVYRHQKGGAFATPQDYARAQAVSGAAIPAPGLKLGPIQALEFRSERSSRSGLTRSRSVLFPAEDGFFALVHTAPSPAPPSGAAVFDELLKSFRIR